MKSSSNLAIVIQLQCGVLPATAVEPNVAFTLHLMEMTLRLIVECQVSIT
jgi:hypothetical protein